MINKEREGGAQKRRIKHKIKRGESIGSIYIYEKFNVHMCMRKLIFKIIYKLSGGRGMVRKDNL